jgi:hypothetical protein
VSCCAALSPPAALRLGTPPPWWPKPQPVSPSLICQQAVNGREKDGANPPRDPRAIQERVRSSYGLIRDCYEDALGRHPRAQGLLQTRFMIEADGRTSYACLQKIEIEDNEFALCLLGRFREMTFGPAAQKVTVVYPLRFEPAGGIQVFTEP